MYAPRVRGVFFSKDTAQKLAMSIRSATERAGAYFPQYAFGVARPEVVMRFFRL